LLKLAAALQNPANRTPFIAQALTDEITGIGPLLPLLNQGPERVKGYLDEGQTITQAQTEAARRIEQAVSRLAFVLERIANKVFLSPESEHTAIEILGGARDIAQGNVIRGLKRINASVPGPAPPIETPLEPVTSQALWWVRHFPPTGRSNPVRGVDDVGFPGATRPQWFAPYLQLPVHPSVPSAAGFDRFGGDVNNSRTVHINAVHVTAPAGADPFEFGRQISAAVQAQMGSR
jgi:hypothetical protein